MRTTHRYQKRFFRKNIEIFVKILITLTPNQCDWKWHDIFDICFFHGEIIGYHIRCHSLILCLLYHHDGIDYIAYANQITTYQNSPRALPVRNCQLSN